MGPLDPSRLGAFLMRQIPPSDGEVVERGNVLPLGTYRTPDGQETTTLAFPQPMREGLDALAYALGYRQDPNAPAGYVTHDALNKGGQGLAESAMVGGIAMPKPKNALGMFAGRNAKTADLAALERAMAHAERGSGRDYIWKTTGWFQGPDGKWRFEIDDSQATMRDPLEGGSLSQRHIEADPESKSVTVPTAMEFGDYMKHAEMERAYDDLPGVLYENNKSRLGGYDKANNLIMTNTDNPWSADAGRSVGLHELQHFIQKREGFTGGQSAGYLQQYADNLKNMITAQNWKIEDARMELMLARKNDPDRVPELEATIKRAKEEIKAINDKYNNAFPVSAYDSYKRAGGEVEARAVQARRDLTPEERRARPPWLDYDVPESDILAANPMAGAVPLAFPAPQEDRNQALARFLASGGA